MENKPQIFRDGTKHYKTTYNKKKRKLFLQTVRRNKKVGGPSGQVEAENIRIKKIFELIPIKSKNKNVVITFLSVEYFRKWNRNNRNPK